MTRLRLAFRPADRAARPAGKRSGRRSDAVAPDSKRARDLARRVHTGLVRLRRTSSRILDVPRRTRKSPMPAGLLVVRVVLVVLVFGALLVVRCRQGQRRPEVTRHPLATPQACTKTGNSDSERRGVIIWIFNAVIEAVESLVIAACQAGLTGRDAAGRVQRARVQRARVQQRSVVPGGAGDFRRSALGRRPSLPSGSRISQRSRLSRA